MAKAKRVPLRKEIPLEDTWDLSPLFKDDAAWERALKKLARMTPGFERFRGKLGRSAKTLHDCCVFEVEFGLLAERLRDYAFLRSAEDVANSHYQDMAARFTHLATRAQEASSFIAPEIQAIPKKTMSEFLKSPALAEFRFMLEQLLRFKPHILSEAEERILAMQGEVANSARRVFGQLDDADLTFGTIVNERGETVELTQGSFRSLLESPKRSVRKEAFDKFYAGYEAHANTFAATLSASVLQDVYETRVRKHPTSVEAALFGDKVPLRVYESLIAAVHANLKTVYRYLDLRRRALRIKDIHMYDTYVPIVQLGPTRNPYSEAVRTIFDALRPLGKEYAASMGSGLLGRWVDRYENQGKRSGAFSSGGYHGPPYILMNYREDVLDSMFTLAHEAGHSMHTYYGARNQPFQYYQYTIFVAEVASTVNEQLLSHYLLERATDKKTRAYLINREIDEIRGTIVRQTMFAEFETIIHAIAENGEGLTLERLRNEYRALLDRYFGPDFAVDDALSLEGLRIPHFYSAFYVYKYATGLSAAIALSRKILEGDARARDRYLTFLKSGGSKYPLDLLRDAGVDMERPEPVATAMKRLDALVTELEELL